MTSAHAFGAPAVTPAPAAPDQSAPLIFREETVHLTRAPLGPKGIHSPQTHPRGGIIALAPFDSVTAAKSGSLLASAEPVIEGATAFPPPGVGESATHLGSPAPLTSISSSYVFQNASSTAGDPVTWSPCRPIHFVINASGTPTTFAPKVLGVVDEFARATGLKFVYDGTTSETVASDRKDYQPDRYGSRWAPVLVGASTTFAASVPASTAGLTSLVRVSNQADPAPHYVTGQIAVFEAAFTDTLPDGTPLVDQVLRHEFGHLVGLGHTRALDQVMDSPNTGVARLQAGDLTGLNRLGEGTCAPAI